jgi:PqqD family protein of HPr-rel-A system
MPLVSFAVIIETVCLQEVFMDPEHLRDLALSDSGFVFDPVTGHTFTINATGGFAIRCLKEGLTAEETAQRMSEQFSVGDNEDCGRDLRDFVLQLRECGLVR